MQRRGMLNDRVFPRPLQMAPWHFVQVASLVRLSPAIISGTRNVRLPRTPEFGRVVQSASTASVVETERVFSERMSLRRGVGVVRLALLLPCSVGNRREKWRRKMVRRREMVKRKMVRRKRWSLLLPLQTRYRLSQVKVVASSCGPVVKKYCGVVRSADGTRR